MKLTSVEAIVGALNAAGVRYLVAGGLAVNAHGYLRFTKDVDLVLSLDRDNILRALTALSALGYAPTIPVTAEQFADPKVRRSWIQEKNMRVFQLWSDHHRETPIDLFVEEPFDFIEEDSQALVKQLSGAGEVRFVSLRSLIRMKETADRPQDRIDVEHLRMRLEGDAETT